MPEKTNPMAKREGGEERIDDQTAASEEAAEEREESSVVAEADANTGAPHSMQEFDIYIRPQEPNLGLYVRVGAPLPDFADSKGWIFYRAVAEDELSSELVHEIKMNGQALQKLD